MPQREQADLGVGRGVCFRPQRRPVDSVAAVRGRVDVPHLRDFEVDRAAGIDVRAPGAFDDASAAIGKEGSLDDSIELKIASSPGQSSQVVIDDDDFIRDSLERLLRGWGWSAMSCRSADQAIDCLRASDDPRAVILLIEYRLAGQDDGLAVIDRIRGEFGATIRAVLMTGDIDNSALSEGAKDLGIPVLRKPIKPIRLRAALTPMADIRDA